MAAIQSFVSSLSSSCSVVCRTYDCDRDQDEIIGRIKIALSFPVSMVPLVHI